MEKQRNKYDPSFKTDVITEFFQGASAKELSKKYGVKERTIYAWSKSAKENITVAPTNNIFGDEDMYKQIRSLEERMVKIEELLKLIKDNN